MKNKATGLLKQVMSALTSTMRTKTLALKGKTNAFRTGLIIFSLLRNNKILMPTSISQKLHALIGHHPKQSEQGQAKEEEVDQSKSPYNHRNMSVQSEQGQAEEEVVDQSKSPYNHRNMSIPTNPRRAQYMKNIIEDNDKDSNFIYSYGKEDDHDQEEEED